MILLSGKRSSLDEKRGNEEGNETLMSVSVWHHSVHWLVDMLLVTG
ncbi:MAG: hypothetical protein RIC06_09260 [Cyclobacteriaceae bacterium]